MNRAMPAVALLLAAGCGARLTGIDVEASSRRLRRCPFGHTDLRDVPIMYGLLWRTEELQRQIDNLEVWPGGCCVWDAKNKVVCAECGYAYEPLYRAWEGKPGDRGGAGPPLSRLVAELPVISCWQPVGHRELAVRKPQPGSYSHCVRGDMVVVESIVYWSSEKHDALAGKIVDYLTGKGIEFSRKESTFTARGRRSVNLALRGRHDGRCIEIEVEYHESNDSCYVHVESVDARAKGVIELKFPFGV